MRSDLTISSDKPLVEFPKGELGFKFPTGGRGKGGPGRAEKNFYLYISRKGKDPLKHVYEPLGAQVHRWELKQRAVVG